MTYHTYSGDYAACRGSNPSSGEVDGFSFKANRAYPLELKRPLSKTFAVTDSLGSIKRMPNMPRSGA